MARLIHISDSKGRDANVLFSAKTKKSGIRFLTGDGDETHQIRVLKTTVNGSYEHLLKKYNSDVEIANALVEGDPEIDFEKTGYIIESISKVFVDGETKPCVTVNVTEKVFNTAGEVIEERIPKELLGNIILDDSPLRPSGKLFAKADVYNRFVFSKRYQLSHTNGLTFDFLFEIAKELDDKKSLMLIGSGEKGMGPLVFQDGGKGYRVFLEGRIRDKSYILLLHLSNLELKPVSV